MNLVVFPFLIPVATAVISLFVTRPSWRRRHLFTGSAILQFLVALVLFARADAGEVLTLAVGSWPAPFGITLVVDRLAAVMVVLGTFTGLLCQTYGMVNAPPAEEHPLRLPLMHLLLAGINLSFLTGDLFNLYVAFEVFLLASYGLLTLTADDHKIRRALPYLLVNLVGSALFLGAAGLAYGLFGTLNFADMAVRATEMGDDPRVLILGLLLVLVFAIKAGIWPFLIWLPNSYPTLPTELAGLFSGMLTKVGVYVLLRLTTTVLPHHLTAIHDTLAWLAGATMILGVLGAVSRNRTKEILSYHIVSQVGFMVLAIGFFTPLAIAACVLYVIHHIVVKSSLFLIGGITEGILGTDQLGEGSGVFRRSPWLATLFVLQAFSLAGLPPLSGFFGKYALALEGFRISQGFLVVLSLVASVLTLFSMLKIWFGAFLGPAPAVVRPLKSGLLWCVTMAVIVSLGIGILAPFVFAFAERTAEQLMNPTAYQDAVFALSSLEKVRPS